MDFTSYFRSQAFLSMLYCYENRNTFILAYNLEYDHVLLGLGSWCLTPLSTIFQLYRGSQFYWWRKPEKNTDQPQITEKPQSHNVVFNGIRADSIVVDRH